MYAYIGESEAYEACTTDAVAFTVSEAAVRVTVDGTDFYYAGFEEALAAANQATGDAIELTLLADCTA